MVRLSQDHTITAHHPPPRTSRGRVRLGHPRAGQLLSGRYRLRQPVTIEPAGAVWRAYDELLAREVAAKQLPDRHFRGLAEARIAARVRHPSVATLGEDGRLILIDFGVAESADNIHPARGSGDIVGSPAYIAPELLRGEAPRPPADLWSLAATLYTAVEGHPPFSGGHTGSTAARTGTRLDPERTFAVLIDRRRRKGKP